MTAQVQVILHRDGVGAIREITVKARSGDISVERVLTKAVLENWRWQMVIDAVEKDPRLGRHVILAMIKKELAPENLRIEYYDPSL